jgi:hypothetical protein
MRLNASGNVQFAGNIGLGGTTPTTSGTGITFPATQSASTDANTLDDYEEGTYTVTMTDSAGVVTITLNSSYNELSYTKIGRVVHLSGILLPSTVTGTWTSGETRISLPFTSADLPDASGRTVMSIGTFNVDWTGGTSPYLGIPEGSTFGSIQVSGDNGVGGAGQVSSSSQIYIGGCYFI